MCFIVDFSKADGFVRKNLDRLGGKLDRLGGLTHFFMGDFHPFFLI